MVKKEKVQLESNLKALLKKEELSLHKVASKVQINKSSLHNYLNGVVPQGLYSLIKLSHFFNISLDELIFEQPQSSSKSQGTHKEEKYEITIKRLEK